MNLVEAKKRALRRMEIKMHALLHFGQPTPENGDAWEAKHITPYMNDYKKWEREVEEPTAKRCRKQYHDYVRGLNNG